MKRYAFFLVGIITLFCGGCQKESTHLPIEENHSTFEDSVKPDIKDDLVDETKDDKKEEYPDCIDNYAEPEDSMVGIEQSTVDLIVAGSRVGETYTTKHEHFLTEESEEYYKINYGEEIKNNFSFNQEKVDAFTLSNLNTEYITNGEFVRVSQYKYESTKRETVYDFLQVVHPGLKNDGYYLTFNKITIELNQDNVIYRVRLYVNVTQTGKLIESHRESKNSNWYLLFAQCYLVNEVK